MLNPSYVSRRNFHRRHGRAQAKAIPGGSHCLGLVMRVLGHVADQAPDLERPQARDAASLKVVEERPQEERPAHCLVGEVGRRTPGALALDQDPDDALAVSGHVAPPLHIEDAVIALVDEPVQRLAHTPEALVHRANSLLLSRKPARECLSAPSRLTGPLPGMAVPPRRTGSKRGRGSRPGRPAERGGKWGG